MICCMCMDSVKVTEKLLEGNMDADFLVEGCQMTKKFLIYLVTLKNMVNSQPQPKENEQHGLEQNILEMIQDDPKISTRRISDAINVPPSTVWRKLKKNNLIPFTTSAEAV
ncbi:unnamed protein product [Psylliodes chrysocephalus]|uniref:Uncharacterized protein n=1 Tax=Psylliodes chrysocephalus TaxID=3402493 RepID=A0A9P0GL03_9CUCU|nr:unnamed protein product [Psylliodes chrysocephala]